MFPRFSRLRAIFLAAFLGAGAASPTLAADMIGLPEQLPPPPDEPVEWGDGWYLRGDVGWQQVNVPALSGDFGQRMNSASLLSGGIGGGYQFNDWLRADLTIDRTVFKKQATIGVNIWCPYKAVGLSTYDADVGGEVAVGVLANPNDTCTQVATASLNRTSGLANVYFDIIHLWGFTPYVGAGLGLSYNSASSSVAYLRNTDGALWSPDLSLPDKQKPVWVYPYRINGAITPYPIQLPFGPTNLNSTTTRSYWTFAWNVMAGVSYDVAQNLKVDVGYRYLNAGKYTGVSSWGAQAATPTSGDVTSHELRVGVRITAN